MTNTKPLVYVGIDPGFACCGIGVVSYDTCSLLFYAHLPEWTPHELYSSLQWIKNEWSIYKAGVEHVHTMSNQGISSTGKFMKATGIIIGTLNGMRIPYYEITPQKWKTISPTLKGIKGETKTQKKNKSLTYVNERFPEKNFCNYKLKKKFKVDIADAICIAIYMYENSL